MRNDFELQIVRNGWIVRRRIVRKGEPEYFENWVARSDEEMIHLITGVLAQSSGVSND